MGTTRGIDGLLIVDKPEGIISLDVVRGIKHRFGLKKAGHIGTLDPFATGVLPIVINEGTKLVPFLEEGPKEYEVTLKLGEETTTDDCTGEVVSQQEWKNVRPEKMEMLLRAFLGKIHQIPPMFSAVKIQGIPLYRLARKGVEVERKEREVEIYEIQMREMELPLIRFRVSCSKGTYVRTLGRDIGRKAGCGAHLLQLRRIRSGPFTIERAISWESLKRLTEPSALFPWLLSLKAALPGLPEVVGDEHLVRKVRFGKEMMVQDLSAKDLPSFRKGEWLKMSSPEEGLVAILKSEVRGADIPWTAPGVVALRPLRVFQPQDCRTTEDHV
ncbi:MAG TPA: tRNA pseudouridine(55) synthase TruB [Thermodesulfobacteriota bacterium]|nr:tRNA pseudouridine(55) synthase TruB [Thermodesulfobacteriota bacterium]